MNADKGTMESQTLIRDYMVVSLTRYLESNTIHSNEAITGSTHP